jgi:predicted nicotinamide N-methyase
VLDRRFRLLSAEVEVAGHAIVLLRPESSESLISEEDFERDERLPYWAELWPSALILARHVGAMHGAGRSLLELGCGVGLVSTAASRAGFAVTATDYYADALSFTSLNVARNSGREPVVRDLDWRHLPEDLGTFDVVVASDVLYERHYPGLIAAVIARALTPGGVAVIADPGRVAAPQLPAECEARGLVIRDRARLPFAEGGINQTIDVMTITWSPARIAVDGATR